MNEIAALSGVGKSGAQRFVHTLRVLGLVRQDQESKAYTMSPGILTYARSFFASNALHEHAEPFLRDLALRTGETVNLSEIVGTEIVFTLRFPSIYSVSVDLSVGSRLPVFNTSGGRVIIAQWPEERARDLLARSDLKAWTPHTRIDPAELMKELSSVRKAGYAMSDQEAFLGDLSVAAPVFGFDGKCLGAVNIAVPTPRWEKTKVREVLMPLVVDTARQISASLRGE